VDEAYIQDEFNLTGLSAMVPYYDYALDTILDIDTALDTLSEEQQELVDSAAELLYGLIHARFILTPRGLNAMATKYEDVTFGRCHRVHCEGQPMLPVGRSDFSRKFGVTLYCPRCNDIYYPKSRRHGKLDGAFFGTTFPHLFLITFPQLVPAAPADVYTPRIFGFRMHVSNGEPSSSSSSSSKPYNSTHSTLDVRMGGHVGHLEALEAIMRADNEDRAAGPAMTIEEALAAARLATVGAKDAVPSDEALLCPGLDAKVLLPFHRLSPTGASSRSAPASSSLEATFDAEGQNPDDESEDEEEDDDEDDDDGTGKLQIG
jgi:hypothetical protein